MHAFALLLALATSPAPLPTLDQLGWLSGIWVHEAGTTRVEELWSKPRAGTMIGISRTIEGDRTKLWEHTVIEARQDAIVFIAFVKGQPPVEFTLVAVSKDELVFANPAHDFPKKITYRKTQRGLKAIVEGDPGKGFELNYRKG